MRWLMLLLVLLPACQACVINSADFTTLAVSGDDAITPLGNKMVHIRLGEGIQHTYPIGVGEVYIGESSFVHRAYCMDDPQINLYDFSGAIIGSFASDGPIYAWDRGFAGILNWDWQGNPIEGPDLSQAWFHHAISSEGHHVFFENGTLHFSTGNVFPSEWPESLALTPNGLTAVMGDGARMWARGEYNWNWTLEAHSPAGGIVDVTASHAGTNLGYRLDLATGAVDVLLAPGEIQFAAADDELFWILEDGTILSEQAKWSGESWTKTEHPGWQPVGQGTPFEEPATPNPSEEAPAVGWLFAIPILAFFMSRRDA